MGTPDRVVRATVDSSRVATRVREASRATLRDSTRVSRHSTSRVSSRQITRAVGTSREGTRADREATSRDRAVATREVGTSREGTSRVATRGDTSRVSSRHSSNREVSRLTKASSRVVTNPGLRFETQGGGDLLKRFFLN